MTTIICGARYCRHNKDKSCTMHCIEITAENLFAISVHIECSNYESEESKRIREEIQRNNL